MPRPLKTYGALMMRSGKQYRIAVATHTKKAAFEAMRKAGWSGGYGSWNEYACETGNKREIEVATSKPGAVFINMNPRHWGSNEQWEELQ